LACVTCHCEKRSAEESSLRRAVEPDSPARPQVLSQRIRKKARGVRAAYGISTVVEGQRRGDRHVDLAGTPARIEPSVSCERMSEGRDSLREVFDRSADALYRFVLVRVGGNRDIADDLLQQTCCEAARHPRPPDGLDQCEAWLRGIARNLVRRHWRNRKREIDAVPLEDAALASRLADDLESRPLPPDVLIRQESVTQLLLAITSLSAADQSLIFDYYFEQRPQAAIARELGVTEKSVESRLYRVRGRLRAALRNPERSGE
jgi:RNA polymerase sigma factor (sigma-70 family)